MRRLFVFSLVLLLTSCTPPPEPKYVCTKSHTESNIEYGYGLRFDGKMGWGTVLVHKDICDKEELNPKYTGLK